MASIRSFSEILLSGLLWVAAQDGRDMARVCEWVMVQDRPREDGLGDVRTGWNRCVGVGSIRREGGADARGEVDRSALSRGGPMG